VAVRLTVTNNLGCASTQTVYPFGAPTASQQAQALARRAQLYPNPATGQATLALAGLPPRAIASVQAYDALGWAVGAAHPLPVAADGTAALRLAVAGWPVGVYAVRVQAGALSFARRLVVE
jgi:hypothetical protein